MRHDRPIPPGGWGIRGIGRACLLLSIVLLGTAGCQTQRIEYHRRPGFYRAAATTQLPDRVTLKDGTVIVYRTGPVAKREGGATGGRPFEIREEREDGSVILRATVPEHVLVNTLTCLRNQEYELLWEQMLAERTKREYERQGQGVKEFTEFFETQRLELAATLTRMLMGLHRQEAVMDNLGGGVIRFRLHPVVAEQFKFKTADVVSEPGGMRLLMMR